MKNKDNKEKRKNELNYISEENSTFNQFFIEEKRQKSQAFIKFNFFNQLSLLKEKKIFIFSFQREFYQRETKKGNHSKKNLRKKNEIKNKHTHPQKEEYK